MHDDKIAKRELLIRVLVLVFAPLPGAVFIETNCAHWRTFFHF